MICSKLQIVIPASATAGLPLPVSQHAAIAEQCRVYPARSTHRTVSLLWTKYWCSVPRLCHAAATVSVTAVGGLANGLLWLWHNVWPTSCGCH